MLQRLKIPLISLICAAMPILFAGCRHEPAAVRPPVEGYNAAGRLQKCAGLTAAEDCSSFDASDEARRAFMQKCAAGNREVVYCHDCAALCAAPVPVEGTEPAQ